MDLFPVASNKAPNNALVAGGYFNASLTSVLLSFSVTSFKIASNRVQADEGLLSGIFFI